MRPDINKEKRDLAVAIMRKEYEQHMATMPTLWIVGKYRRAIKGDIIAWEFGGVFDTEAQAIAACHTDKYFIAPAKLNHPWQDGTEPWIGAYYPRLQSKDEAVTA